MGEEKISVGIVQLSSNACSIKNQEDACGSI